MDSWLHWLLLALFLLLILLFRTVIRGRKDAKQLNDYANGARTSDGKTGIMRDIAAQLSKEDIDALASYVQGLR